MAPSRKLDTETLTRDTIRSLPRIYGKTLFKNLVESEHYFIDLFEGIAKRIGLLENERAARNRAEKSESRLALLARVNALFSRPFGDEASFQSFANEITPLFSDGCVVDLMTNEGSFLRIAAAHPEPAKQKILQKLLTNFPTHLLENPDIQDCIKSNQAKIVRAHCYAPDFIEEFKKLKMSSLMVTSLRKNGAAVGLIFFINTEESKRKFNGDDIAFANEIGQRASIAFENARLFKEARDAIQIRDEFLSIASHELKTPITSMKMRTELNLKKLKQNPASFLTEEGIRKFLVSNKRQIEQLTKLVDQMLDISKIVHGKLQIQPEEVDLAELARDVIDRTEDQALAQGSVLTLTTGKSISGILDRFRIEQVMTNLIVNAIKYGAGKPIVISLTSTPNSVGFEVKDHGIGIESANLDRIFQRFERAISPNEVSGLGLGLYISRQIVEAHNGTISVKSKINEGSVFAVEFPLNSTKVL